MSDIVERLRRKVFHGPTMEAAHTRTVEWQAADEITRLRAQNEALVAALERIGYTKAGQSGADLSECIAIARAALSKAEGEKP